MLSVIHHPFTCTGMVQNICTQTVYVEASMNDIINNSAITNLSMCLVFVIVSRIQKNKGIADVINTVHR